MTSVESFVSSTCVWPVLVGNYQLPFFQIGLAVNTHTMILDIHRNAVTGQEGTNNHRHPVSATFRP